ncbi:CRISPR-associated protein Cas4 [Paenibacillus riograndensis]|uniref:CRISPR-associated exonuclease Cas4 n=1 Tax=Paenibacillus riograndensis SBR5 TaxID=1073571 RepID=A0A0E4H8V8_9BACL|nr:CRISPR-associated protein Cas4 [Paenibacillus riograndensis]CQR53515.1 RecB family exonuclease [Paenibacillus riograndensis SBR5]
MEYDDEDELMLSGIQHFHFCKRQWALIHIEQQWEENVRTIEGQHLHRNADQPLIREKRVDKIIVRAMPVKSRELNISGICDVVEFIRDDSGVEINGADGKYAAYPVEYKRGKPKREDEDILQLAAQAMCLEEMLLCEVSTGYIFYNEIKHRIEVPLTAELKANVKAIVEVMQSYYHRRHTPKVKTGPFCKSCSLQHICLPKLMNKQSVKSYVEGKIRE